MNMTARFVPVCLGCGGGASFGIGGQPRDFATARWWCGRCIPPALATWRKGDPARAAAGQPGAGGRDETTAATATRPKQFQGGLF